MTLRLSAALVDEIRKQGEAAYPAECCGALVGRVVEDAAKSVERVAAAVNRRTDDPHRYLIAPDDLW